MERTAGEAVSVALELCVVTLRRRARIGLVAVRIAEAATVVRKT